MKHAPLLTFAAACAAAVAADYHHLLLKHFQVPRASLKHPVTTVPEAALHHVLHVRGGEQNETFVLLQHIHGLLTNSHQCDSVRYAAMWTTGATGSGDLSCVTAEPSKVCRDAVCLPVLILS
jgi:hypothetical protein